MMLHELFTPNTFSVSSKKLMALLNNKYAVLLTDVQHIIVKAPSVLLYCAVIYLLAPNNCYSQPLFQCYYNSVNQYAHCQFSAVILVLDN